MPEIGPGNLKRRATARDHTSEVLSFIQNLTGEIHPALDSSENSAVAVVGLDPVSGKLIFDHPRSIIETQQPVQGPSDNNNSAEPDAELFKPIDPDDLTDAYAQCRETGNHLNQQIERYQLESGKKYTSLNQTHSYEDVDNALVEFAETLRSEEREYKTTALKGFWGHVRRGFRAFSNHSNNLKVFIGLIPSQETYLSVLCGGLTFLCAVGKRMADIREALSEFLEELLAIVQGKGKIMEIFSENMDLHKLNADLCVSILHVMHEFIDWVKTSPGKKTVKALMKPADYKKHIVDKIQKMRQNAKDFKDMASVCGLRDGREVRRALARLEQGQLKRQEQKNILNFVFISYKSDPAQAKVDRSGNARSRKKRTHIQYRAETLLQTYAHDPGLIEEDCSNLLNLRYTLPKPEQDRAVALMHDERFQALTNTLDTTKLLVHGGAQHTDTDQSATSFMAARVFDLVSRHAGGRRGSSAAAVIPLAFFCSQHTGRRDPNAHAPGMLLTLLLELVDQAARRGVRLRASRMRDELRALDPADVGSIAALFRAVEAQLPPASMLFVVVDAIDAYEDDERRAEAVLAVGHLLALGRRGDGVVLKLLVTAPSSTLAVWRLFERGEAGGGAEVVQLPGVCPSRDGFASLDWDDDAAAGEGGGGFETESDEDWV